MMEKAALPISFLIALSVVISLASASQFVGWPLNATELDFLVMPSVLSQKGAFEGTPYLALAENVGALSILPSLVSLLDGTGLPAERQMVLFGLLQALFVCAGAIGVFMALGGRHRPWLVGIGFVLFVGSGRHYLNYFKIVSSTFVSGLVILALAAAAGRKLWVAALVAGVVGMVHPTYFLLTAGGIVFVHWLGAGRPFAIDRAYLTELHPLIWVTLPIVAIWLLNREAILQPALDTDRWLAYMQARSDLAFPLRQGYYDLVGMVIPLGLASIIFRMEHRETGTDAYHRLEALPLLGILFVVVQIIGSEVLRSATITRLALSHRLMFTIDILVFLAVIFIALRRYADSGGLAWLALLWFGILRSLPSVWPAAGLTGRGTLYAAVLTLLMVERAAPGVNRLPALRVAGNTVIRQVALVMTFVAALGLTLRQFSWHAVAVDMRAFALQRDPMVATDRWRPRLEYQEFIRFITTNVNEDEQILAVPFFLTQRYTPIPYRSMYLDWGESNYVLYLGGHLNYVLQRLATYGIDPDKRPKECTLEAMFLARSGAEYSQCQRLAFQNQAMHERRAWRDHVDAIQGLSPRTTWVLIERSFLCPGEQPNATWSSFALIRLSDVIRRSSCVPA